MSNKSKAKKAPTKKVGKRKSAKRAAKKKTAARRGAAKKAKRYAEDFKKQVLDFVESVGRGGATQAAKKFGVSPISISNWKKKLGLKGGSGSAGGSGASSPKASSRPASRDQIIAKLGRLSTKLTANENEQAALQKEFDQLKAKL